VHSVSPLHPSTLGVHTPSEEGGTSRTYRHARATQEDADKVPSIITPG
jgi:hypothetical protein